MNLCPCIDKLLGFVHSLGKLFLIKSEPYSIIYQVIGDDIYIHCILDGRSDIQTLLKGKAIEGLIFEFRKRKTPRDQTKDAGKTSVSPFIL